MILRGRRNKLIRRGLKRKQDLLIEVRDFQVEKRKGQLKGRF